MKYIYEAATLINHIIIAILICIPISFILGLPIFYALIVFKLYVYDYGSWLMMLVILGVYPFVVCYIALLMKMKDVVINWLRSE